MVALKKSERCNIIETWKKLGSIKGVSKRLGYNIKTVRRWVKRYEMSKDVDEAVEGNHGGGAKQALKQGAALVALDLLLNDNVNGASQVAQKVKSMGLTEGGRLPSKSTIIRVAKAAAIASDKPIVALRGQPKKMLSPDTVSKRKRFCEANINKTWSNTMFTDRCKFYFKYPGTSICKVKWVNKGEQWTAPKPNRPSALNIYAGITIYGITKSHVVSGTTGFKTTFKNLKGKPAKNINSNEYQVVLEDTLLPEGKRLFGNNGVSNWVLQQDNDPAHKRGSKAALEAWNKSHPCNNINLLEDWPPNSPDLSIIENVWAWVQQKVEAAGCQTFTQFKMCVFHHLKHVPKSMIRNLFKSVKRRVKECSKDGAKLRH